MKQILSLLIIFLIWIIPLIIKGLNQKKNKAFVQNQNKKDSRKKEFSQNENKHTNTHNSNIEQILENLLHVDIAAERQDVFTEKTSEVIDNDSENQEYEAEIKEDVVTEEPVFVEDINKNLTIKNIEENENNIHPDILDFNLRKAVIYSEILKPKYF